MLSICDENRTTHNILFSYDIWNDDIDKEIDSINKLNEKYKNDFILHIAITRATVPNDVYENIVEESNTYIKTISDREKRDVYNSYFAIHELSIEREHNYNAWADSIFRKFLESTYLIYKEILCKKYNFNNVGKNFLQTNIGIGNYPYAMRRAISFEKKRIENELKKAVESCDGKVETILDLNCLGGLYGMRLSKYAKKIVCIDTCKDVLNSIKETIEKYNELLPENNIRNVKYGLLREDSYDILMDKQDELKADCIIMGLGTLSYIEDPKLFISQIANYIKKDGFIFISCYNADSLSIKLGKYENLNYRYDPYRKCFVYSNEKINMSIPVHLYTLAQFKRILLKYFDVNGEAIWSYPTLVSIFQESNYANGIEVIKEMDKKCAVYQYPAVDHGNYNMAILKKQQTNYVIDIYQKVIDTIHEKNIKYKSVYHDPIMSSEDLNKLKKLKEEHVFITSNNFIKTLILIDSYNAPYTYYMIILPAKKKFQIENLRKYYKIQKREKAFDVAYNKGEIHACDESDLIKMGITLGSVSPFSYPALHSLLKPDHDIVLVYDCSIIGLPYEYIYTYSGKNNMSFEIKK